MSEPLAVSRNIRLTLAYDGADYCGWQVQPNGLTIQAVLEQAIERLTGERSPVLSAGRTDAGVHALAQVANFKTGSPIPAENFRAALQTHLPPDIVILDSHEVPVTFHATFAAKRKRYRYVMYNGIVMLPFLRRYAHHVRRPLDVDAMQAAAQVLIGTHDFRSFESDWPNKATSIRTVTEITLRRSHGWWPWEFLTVAEKAAGSRPVTLGEDSDRSDAGDRSKVAGGDFIILDIQADGFLYNMVRSITGTLINIGCGRWSADDVRKILEAQRRSAAGNTAPACGLYLAQVDYD